MGISNIRRTGTSNILHTLPPRAQLGPIELLLAHLMGRFWERILVANVEWNWGWHFLVDWEENLIAFSTNTQKQRFSMHETLSQNSAGVSHSFSPGFHNDFQQRSIESFRLDPLVDTQISNLGDTETSKIGDTGTSNIGK